VIVPCDYRGPVMRSIDCGCGGPRVAYACHCSALVGRECVLTPLMPKATAKFGAIQACGKCPERTWKGVKTETPTEPAAVVTTDYPTPILNVELDVLGLSPSLCRHHGKNWLAFLEDDRSVRIAPVTDSLVVGESKAVYLSQIPESLDGKRAVKLHSLSSGLTLTYTGLSRGRETCVLVPLTDAGEPLGQMPLRNGAGSGRDGDWTLFEQDRAVRAVAGWNPMLTLLIENGDAVSPRRSRWNCSWIGGEMVGGAPPVVKDGEFFAWFNSPSGIGVLTFSRAAPFHVARCCSRVLYTEANGTRVGGVFYNHGRWTLSLGSDDGKMRFVQFTDLELNRELVSV